MKSIRIRAITVGADLNEYNPIYLTNHLKYFYHLAEETYFSKHFPVQTRRLTLPPTQITDPSIGYKIKSTLDTLNRLANEVDIRWLCLPINGHAPLSNESLQIIVNILREYPRVFLHFMVASEGNIYHSFLTAATRCILAVSRLSSNGYDNFRVGVGANINPNTPYFPFSYHEGQTGFSLAVELIEHLIQMTKVNKSSVDNIREPLIESIIPIIQDINLIGITLEQQTGLVYKGLDISIAPFPDETRSVAALIEMFSSAHSGQLGTLMATSILTDILKTALNRSKVRHTGFNGVMFSLLEDQGLAKANNQRHLTIEKLMLYSTVCGCGIDMVPIPGDIFEEELNSLILDVAALSSVLHKPLGVRILPIPMKSANEFTHFNHDFLTNTRIMSVEGQKFSSLLLSSEHSFNYLRFKNKEFST